jgi:hypothetical protein
VPNARWSLPQGAQRGGRYSVSGEEKRKRTKPLVQLGGYCRRSTLSLINLAFLLAKDRLLQRVLYS